MTVINTNTNALVARNAINANSRTLQTAMQQLATGSKINRASDDAAGLAIRENMTSQIKGFNAATTASACYKLQTQPWRAWLRCCSACAN